MLQLLAGANALRIVFEYGFELKDENFIELTYDQYESLERQGADISSPWFRVSRGFFEERNNPPAELPIVNQEEKKQLLEAVALVYKMTERSGESFADFRERLAYLKDRLPPAISGSTESPRKSSQKKKAPPEPKREEERLHSSIVRYFERVKAIQDAGRVDAATEELIEFIVFQSRLEAQLGAIELLARRPTFRGLGYLRHIYRLQPWDHRLADAGSEEYKKMDPRWACRHFSYNAPKPLRAALHHKIEIPPSGLSKEEVDRFHEEFVQQSEAHQIVRAAIRKAEQGLERLTDHANENLREGNGQ